MQRPNAKTLQTLLDRAAKVNVEARLIKNVTMTNRKHGVLGSTSRPPRVIMLNGQSFSLRGARLHLDARERRAAIEKSK